MFFAALNTPKNSNQTQLKAYMTSKPIYFCVYRISNLVENKHYYGYKSSKIHPSKVIGITYFSSSKNESGKQFIADQKENPQNYKYKIVQIFNSKEEALSREIKLHNKFDVARNPNFYNKSNQTSTGFSYDWTNKNHSKDTISKISKSNKGKTKGRKHTVETCAKRSKSMEGKNVGKIHSIKSRVNMSLGHKKFLYISPLGTADIASGFEPVIPINCIRCWCNNPDKTISKASYSKSTYLQENYSIDILGKTFRDIGFYKIKILDYV